MKLLSVILAVSLLVANLANGENPATQRTLVTVAATAVPTAYPAATPGPQFVSTNAQKQLEIINLLNCDVTVSFDGSTEHKYVPAGSSWTQNLAANNQYEGRSISIKSAAACTSGSIYFQGAN